MRALLNPVGILLANTLSGGVLMLLFGSTFSVIHPLLDAEAITAWWWVGGSLAIIVFASTVYAIACLRMRRPVGSVYAIVLFLFLATLLYLTYEHLNLLLPWSLPRWMVGEDERLWPMRLLTPALAHAIMIMVVRSRKEGEDRKPWLDALLAVTIPVVCWAGVQVLEPMRFTPRGDAARHAFIVFAIALVCTFLFFLLRAIHTMVLRKNTDSEWNLLWKVPVAVLLPLIGLLLNNGALPWVGDLGQNGPFGDLGHPMFYAIAILNGMAVCIPDEVTPRVRLSLFVLRSIGYSYVLYFFILFLPLLPFSLAAIIGFGLGFLLLAPIMLFALQTTQLARDVRFLGAFHPVRKLIVLLVACMLVIPLGITVKYRMHRSTLNDALDHVYHADLSRDGGTDVDNEALARVLEQVEANRSSRRSAFGAGNTPFLSAYYNWLVLDNLTLSFNKVDRLERIFNVGDQRERDRRWGSIPQERGNVLLERTTAKATKDEHGTWSTWVELEMKNHGHVQEEYATAFRLPPGSFIGGHYLWIDDRKEPGILAERKAAEWIYQQITVIERRDPSLLRHIGPDEYELLVFPFEGGQTRRMGFEVLSKEARSFSIDSMVVRIGGPSDNAATTVQRSDGSVFIPAREKLKLPLVVRPTHQHFILDVSGASGFDQRIEHIAKAITDPARATIWLTDACARAVPAGEDWRGMARDHVPNGGFFAGRAVQRILYEHMTQRTGERPVIIVVTDERDRAEFMEGQGHLAFAMPEDPTIHWLNSDGGSQAAPLASPHALRDGDAKPLGQVPVRVWSHSGGNIGPDACLPNDSAASMFIHDILRPPNALAGTEADRWINAQDLAGQWMRMQLHPGAGDAVWRDLVRASFRAQVLSPATAFIAVENEAQKNALLKKQEEVLNGDAALDAGDEELQSMSEPGSLVLLIPIALWILLRRRALP